MYHLFVDYRADFDRPVSPKLYEDMSEIVIPAKLLPIFNPYLIQYILVQYLIHAEGW